MFVSWQCLWLIHVKSFIVLSSLLGFTTALWRLYYRFKCFRLVHFMHCVCVCFHIAHNLPEYTLLHTPSSLSEECYEHHWPRSLGHKGEKSIDEGLDVLLSLYQAELWASNCYVPVRHTVKKTVPQPPCGAIHGVDSTTISSDRMQLWKMHKIYGKS